MKFLLCCVLLSILACTGSTYRILCLFPFNAKSHHRMFDALCKGLARRGHTVDMISHYPTAKPPENFHDIVDLNGTMKGLVNNFTIEYAHSLNNDIVYNIAVEIGEEICQLMGSEQMRKFIESAPKGPRYDLVLTEYFGSPCYIGFGPYLKAPVAVITSSLEMPHVHTFLGNPSSYAFFPAYHTQSAVLAGFRDRLINTLVNMWEGWRFAQLTERQTEITRKYLGADLPDVRELEKYVSLFIVNTLNTYHGIRPTTPAFLPAGGLHIEGQESELSKDLKAWFDSAQDGVVYFTLGSLVNIETISKEQLLEWYASFARIAPVKVLMKCANSTRLPPGLPSNVRTSSWIPQIPVLKHKNTKVFITHGGLMGSLEALHFGVPLIGIPLFADQIRNINLFVHKGMAVKLKLDEIDKVTMDRALDAVLKDPKYMKAAKRASALFRDRPLSQMDEAIYMIEYVIRHGPDALKSQAVHLSCWQLHLFDVYAFIIGGLAIILYFVIWCSKLLIRSICGTKRNIVSKRKKRN